MCIREESEVCIPNADWKWVCSWNIFSGYDKLCYIAENKFYHQCRLLEMWVFSKLLHISNLYFPQKLHKKTKKKKKKADQKWDFGFSAAVLTPAAVMKTCNEINYKDRSSFLYPGMFKDVLAFVLCAYKTVDPQAQWVLSGVSMQLW